MPLKHSELNTCETFKMLLESAKKLKVLLYFHSITDLILSLIQSISLLIAGGAQQMTTK